MAIETTRELEFSIFCVDFVADKLQLSPKIVYEKLKSSGLLDDYIIANYEVLHTLGKDYLVNDIIKLMQERDLL